jgi:hypothetical protein
MPEKAEPKISVSEAVLIGLFLAILDVIDLFPIAGDLTDVAAAPLVLYYFMKNINGTVYIIAWVMDLIPILQELPNRSIAWWGTVIFERVAPAKLEQAVEAVGEAVEGNEGEAGEKSPNFTRNNETGMVSVETSDGHYMEIGVNDSSEDWEANARGHWTKAGENPEQGDRETTEARAMRVRNRDRNADEGGGGKKKDGGGKDISETESERDPSEVEEEKLFEGSGEDEEGEENESGDEEEGEEVTSDPAGNTVGIDSSKKWRENQRGVKPTNKQTSVYDVKPKRKAA